MRLKIPTIRERALSENPVKGLPSKISRHAAISQLLTERVVRSQGELRELLETEGFAVTQATLSRDLDELHAVKVRDRDGNQRYALSATPEQVESPLPLPGTLERWCAQLLVRATAVTHQIVLRTPPAAAPALAAAIDKENLAEVLGCVAGDDTVLVICATPQEAEKLCADLQNMTSR
ncbi:arginine repressor [Mobiluncus mulieris]|uniref:Arginine repressor n=1 Tax=Mobiluncus mulieris TaxID=2052 RepID=A0A2X1TKF0_9ACTO|nr:arginine repressor [Mobiluncus mulieris]EFN93774.1 arginine repressor [Mobiluncus mulieris FB024-16]SPX71193.1 Arginine hydroxamate resistance protein [Mobiluncus mulieris]STO15521.1 Arginine hydroxamate resistance protein [Mobiluncus mulieris]STY84495.1 Arginine hydroxamate resistance protein [Mobiluncus mulieris]